VAAPGPPVAGDQGPSPRRNDVGFARRLGAFSIWWLLLMVLWVWVDDSTDTPELLVGAAVAAMAASFAVLVQHQAASPVRIRIEWLTPLATVPLQVLRDLGVVFAALWKRITRGELPNSRLEEIRVEVSRGESAEAVTQRSLVVGFTSIAPNTFALGVDPERGTMIVHRLVADGSR
jgi:multisubunit Na+/H+ antiporter MnhE subunit